MAQIRVINSFGNGRSAKLWILKPRGFFAWCLYDQHGSIVGADCPQPQEYLLKILGFAI